MNNNEKIDLAVRIGRLQLKNPVLTASGTFGYGEEYAEFLDLNLLGGIVVKGMSLHPREGNPPPRIVETPAGMLNAVGLQNIGIERFVKEKLPFLRQFNTPVIVNFFGDSVEEFTEAAARLNAEPGIDALEMNISCPNKQAGWCIFGTNPKIASEVIRSVRKKTDMTLIVKLSPNVTDISLMARVAEESGADAVSLINTITGMVIDVETWKPMLANWTGGLSGPAIRPVAVRMVWEAAKAVSIPVIGVGGITNYRDAIEFMLAGATAIEIGTANFINPRVTMEITEGIRAYLAARQINSVRDITGKVHGASSLRNADH